MNYWVISNNDITVKICFNTFLVKLRRSIIVIKMHHWSICVFSYFYRNFSWNKKKIHSFIVSPFFHCIQNTMYINLWFLIFLQEFLLTYIYKKTYLQSLSCTFRFFNTCILYSQIKEILGLIIEDHCVDWQVTTRKYKVKKNWVLWLMTLLYLIVDLT